MSEILKIDPVNIDSSIIKKAADYIVEGKLVAFPTETVYGIGANAFDESAVNKIFAVKKRPTSDPLIVHIYRMSQLSDVVQHVPDIALKLAKEFWPGPLTLILERNPKIPANVSSGLATVAVRMPSNPIALELLKSADVPVTAPSANLFTRPSSTSGRHVIEDFDSALDLVLDGGESEIGLESTVVSLTGGAPVILRPGGLSIEALKKVVPNITQQTDYIGKDAVSSSPGMLLKHYSPKAKLMLFSGDDELAVVDKMYADAEQLDASGYKIGVLATSNQLEKFSSKTNWQIYDMGQQGDFARISKSLFNGMRTLDRGGVNYILVSAPATEGLGLAIWDRLYRAAEGNVISVK